MVQIIIIDKSGEITEKNIKSYNAEQSYKLCGFRNPDNFQQRNVWKVNYKKKRYNIELWAKNSGKSNYENKYEFPPPVDKEMYFSKCLIICKENKEVVDLTKEMWNEIYNNLYGGFDDINNTMDDDENEKDELCDISKEKKTKDGYLKDNFVVDCDNDSDGDSDSDSDSDSEYGSELSEEEYIYSSDDE